MSVLLLIGFVIAYLAFVWIGLMTFDYDGIILAFLWFLSPLFTFIIVQAVKAL